MKILKKIRGVMNNNRLYSWMAVFIILIQVLAFTAGGKEILSKENQPLSPEEFRQQTQERQETFKELIKEDERLATTLGFLSMFMIAILITGIVFLTDYIIKKRKAGIEAIPKTLDAPEPLWGIGDVLRVVILLLFFSQLFSVFASILDALFHSKGLDRRAGMIASTGFMDILIFMLMLNFVMGKYKQGIKALGISLKGFFRNIGIALYAYVSFLPILAAAFFIVLIAAKLLNYTPPPQPIYELIFEEERTLLLIAIVAMVSVIGPFIEEVFFRGFLYSALKKRFGIFLGIALSAFLFSLLHTNLLGFIPILALGMFLAYLREKTGSLVPSIIVHVTHNTILTSIMFFVREITSKTM